MYVFDSFDSVFQSFCFSFPVILNRVINGSSTRPLRLSWSRSEQKLFIKCHIFYTLSLDTFNTTQEISCLSGRETFVVQYYFKSCHEFYCFQCVISFSISLINLFSLIMFLGYKRFFSSIIMYCFEFSLQYMLITLL
jgi:hypothetical protein